MKKTFKVIVEVTLEMHGTKEGFIRHNFESILERAYINGQITDDTDAELETYKLSFERTTP